MRWDPNQRHLPLQKLASKMMAVELVTTCYHSVEAIPSLSTSSGTASCEWCTCCKMNFRWCEPRRTKLAEDQEGKCVKQEASWWSIAVAWKGTTNYIQLHNTLYNNTYIYTYIYTHTYIYTYIYMYQNIYILLYLVYLNSCNNEDNPLLWTWQLYFFTKVIPHQVMRLSGTPNIPSITEKHVTALVCLLGHGLGPMGCWWKHEKCMKTAWNIWLIEFATVNGNVNGNVNGIKGRATRAAHEISWAGFEFEFA